MAKKTKKSSNSSLSFSSFLAGVLVGCVASIIVAATAVPVLDDYKPDTSGFPPNIELPPVTTEYLFPDLLERGVDPEDLNDDRKALVDLPVNESTEEPVPQSTPPIESYVLQAGSFEQKQHADTFRAWLILRGYTADVAEVEVSGIGLRYRVLVGPFSSQDDANAAASQLAVDEVKTRLLGIRD